MLPILNSVVEALIKLMPNHKQSMLFEGILFMHCAEKGGHIPPGQLWRGALVWFFSKGKILWNKVV